MKIMGEQIDWFVYIVECSNGAYYCGVTNDLFKRMKTHNAGKGSKYTAIFGPIKLIWFRKVDSNSAARKIECKIKKWGKNKKRKLVQGMVNQI